MIFLESIGSRASLSARYNEARGINYDASCFFIVIGELVYQRTIENQELSHSDSCRVPTLARASAASRRERR